MIRALFLHRDMLFTAGVTKCVYYFARHARRQRVQPHVGSFLPPEPHMCQAFAEIGVPAMSLGGDGHLGPVLALRHYIRRNEIDVVVACSFKSYLVARLATAGLRCRLIFWIHAIQATISGPIRRFLFSRLARRDTLLFVSNAVRNAQIPANHGGRSAVIYNGVADPSRDPEDVPYARSERASHGIAEGDFVITYVAELVPWKDHVTLLQAFDIVVRQAPNARLLLIGEGRDEKVLKALAEGMPCSDRVSFLGARTDARRLLGLADVCVHPGRGEGFGLAVVEAMLARKPVIVAQDGALPEYVHDNRTGLLFPPGDAEALARQILFIRDNPSHGAVLGEAGRRHCLRMFSPSHFADSVTRLIEQVVSPGGVDASVADVEVKTSV